MADKLAGQPVPKDRIINLPLLISDYFSLQPDPAVSTERVAFGTSGHRGSAFKKSFNEAHVLAVTQAVCEYRKEKGYDGPLFMGMDSHALSTPAQMTAVRVCAANGVKVRIAEKNEYTPTPLVSFAILGHNRTSSDKADGIVITPSHNPPEDGGFKYNPPNGGPADTDVTAVVEKRANEILENGLKDVRALSYEEALASPYVEMYDFITPYVESLREIVDMDAIARSGLKIAADPLGGSALGVYKKIKEMYDLNMEIVNPWIDPTFSFMTLDHDGKIRMDCSSPWAMASLVRLKEDYDLAFGNDTDADRHGIVTPVGGLMNPNHYLSVAIWYLFKHRTSWPEDLKIGKTLVSSSMIDRVAADIGKEVYEVPVGFKWFVDGLYEGWLGFGGEESAGASFLRFDGGVWSTDKDGIILNLLAAEIKAVTGRDPAEIYADFEEKFGKSYYARIDAPATPEQKAKLKALSPDDIEADELAGEKIVGIYTNAPGNGAPIGGLKLVTENGWVAMRPSGTEDIYKIYAESFLSPEHLAEIQKSAQRIVTELIG
ncbi:phosphoglucomutase (alpha-D-glucose-1,6-bisphosphate-dependent) [Hydrogenimonas sp.]|uniref:phosphoglucomutase (alpha-D-glucose-1,6-bisphosphate-dependent) n=1 Tax=Hydrogenimonas sp. TaxID=2231112 RepID=UPI00262151BA|nr:phosphoglucomutase (alpha-D-glucose-1,6-bisphosphate-dependent) [Hydrogenimonas sp.]